MIERKVSAYVERKNGKHLTKNFVVGYVFHVEREIQLTLENEFSILSTFETLEWEKRNWRSSPTLIRCLIKSSF